MNRFGSMTREEVEGFTLRMGYAAAGLASQCLTPIVVHQDAASRQHGMGTLFAIANRRFLVTASHVIAKAQEFDLPLSVFDMVDETRPAYEVPLIGQVHQMPDPADVAVLEL